MQYKGKDVSYYIIVTVEFAKGMSILDIVPRNSLLRKKLQLTEQDEEAADESYKHRKYVGFVSGEELHKICDEQDVKSTSVRTLGSITEYGWMPAVSFGNDDDYIWTGIYATPLIDGMILNEDDWEVLRDGVIKEFE